MSIESGSNCGECRRSHYGCPVHGSGTWCLPYMVVLAVLVSLCIIGIVRHPDAIERHPELVTVSVDGEKVFTGPRGCFSVYGAGASTEINIKDHPKCGGANKTYVGSVVKVRPV